MHWHLPTRLLYRQIQNYLMDLLRHANNFILFFCLFRLQRIFYLSFREFQLGILNHFAEPFLEHNGVLSAWWLAQVKDFWLFSNVHTQILGILLKLSLNADVFVSNVLVFGFNILLQIFLYFFISICILKLDALFIRLLCLNVSLLNAYEWINLIWK